jgi:hypothetical protein
LSKRDHQLLALWAADCTERVFSKHWNNKTDPRPADAIQLARAWAEGKISVGEARKASVAAHAAAREADNPAATAIARSAGHAVATAHMADHSMGAAWYALKAAKLLELDAKNERLWQDKMLPDSVRDLILSARALRKI